MCCTPSPSSLGVSPPSPGHSLATILLVFDVFYVKLDGLCLSHSLATSLKYSSFDAVLVFGVTLGFKYKLSRAGTWRVSSVKPGGFAAVSGSLPRNIPVGL